MKTKSNIQIAISIIALLTFSVLSASALPDLITQNFSVSPNSGNPNSTFNVSFTIKNQGTTAAAVSQANVRLAISSSTVTTSDPLLASVGVPSIAAGGTYPVSFTATVPSGRAAGQNDVWVIEDVNSSAGQGSANEANDKSNVPFMVTTPPTVSTSPADLVTATSARLNGTFDSHGLVGTIYFQYGTTTSYGSQTPAGDMGGSAGSVSYTISGLSQNTIYHYRVVGSDSGGTVGGNDATFTTSSQPAPTVSTSSADLVTTTSARLNGTFDSHGLVGTIYFQYGTTTSYGSQTPAGDMGEPAGSVSYTVNSLSPNTLYHYRVVGSDSGGTVNGNDVNFTTALVAGNSAPVITAQPQSQTLNAGNTVTFTVVASGSGQLNYQWRFNGQNISGATSSTLTLNSVAAANGGNYSVIVSNPYGSVTSTTVFLKLVTVDINVPCYLMTVTPLPARQAGKTNLVVVTHGWIPPWEELSSPDWIADLAGAIGTKLNEYNVSGWQAEPYYWITNAETGLNPDAALDHAKNIGTQIGRQIAAQGWQHVHLIAHSAGSALIQAAADAIRTNSPSTVIQTTFLDPYLGTDYRGLSWYGSNADWSDAYYAYDFWTDQFGNIVLLPNLTYGQVVNAYNVDVTWLDPDKKVITNYCYVGESSDSTPTASVPCGQQALSHHEWPTVFYTETVLGTETNCAVGFGFPLSIESGGWVNLGNYHEGFAPNPLCGSSPVAQNQLPLIIGSQLQFSLLPSATSSSGADLSGNSGFVLSSVSQTLSPNGIHALAVTPTTNTPAWLAVGLTITNAVNFVQFDATFADSNNAEGLVTVLWDTNQIGAVDESVVSPGSQTYRFFLPSTAMNNVYVLGFRLDSFDNTFSSIMVTNVATGFVGVTQPSTLGISITNGTPMLQLTGATNYTYLIQNSADLVNWIPTALLSSTNGTAQFMDSPVTNSSARFYRAMPWSALQTQNTSNTYAATLIRSQNQCLTALDSPSLSVTGDMTVEGWVKLASQPSSGSYTIFSKSDENGGQQSFGLRYFNQSGTNVLDAWIYANGTGGPHATLPITIPAGVWTHIAMVYSASAGTVVFYTNGIPVFTHSGMPNSIYDSTAYFLIGAYDNGLLATLLDAKVDDVRLWATARTQAQINSTMKSELSGSEPNLRAYWKLDNDFSDSTTNGNILYSSGNLGFENSDLPF